VAGERYVVFDGAHRGKKWEAARDEARLTGCVVVSSEDVERAAQGRAMQRQRVLAGQYTLPIVTAEEYRRASECAEAVLAHEEAGPLLTGLTEVPLQWELLGRSCAGQLDVIGDGFITDLKTTACAEQDWFTRQALRMAYHA